MPSHLLGYDYGNPDPKPVTLPPVKERLVESSAYPGYFDFPTTAFAAGIDPFSFDVPSNLSAAANAPSTSAREPSPSPIPDPGPKANIPAIAPPPQILNGIFPSRKMLQAALQTWSLSVGFSIVTKTSGRDRMKLGCICGGHYRQAKSRAQLKAEAEAAAAAIAAGLGDSHSPHGSASAKGGDDPFQNQTGMEVDVDGDDDNDNDGDGHGDQDGDVELDGEGEGEGEGGGGSSEMGQDGAPSSSTLIVIGPDGKRRQPKTKRMGCPFVINCQAIKERDPTDYRIVVNRDKWRINPATKHDYSHNHSALDAGSIPGNRKLDDEKEEVLIGYLRSGLSPKLAMERLKDRYKGLQITLKDVNNLRHRHSKRRKTDSVPVSASVVAIKNYLLDTTISGASPQNSPVGGSGTHDDGSGTAVTTTITAINSGSEPGMAMVLNEGTTSGSHAREIASGVPFPLNIDIETDQGNTTSIEETLNSEIPIDPQLVDPTSIPVSVSAPVTGSASSSGSFLNTNTSGTEMSTKQPQQDATGTWHW